MGVVSKVGNLPKGAQSHHVSGRDELGDIMSAGGVIFEQFWAKTFLTTEIGFRVIW